MGHSLRIRVVAEGVERESQLDFLRRHGCDEMQGFLFSQPVPADEVQRLLTAQPSKVPATT
jgi:EAL domain-containing protein (putative c-di-GMP-specific phosphodiesterase class I)